MEKNEFLHIEREQSVNTEEGVVLKRIPLAVLPFETKNHIHPKLGDISVEIGPNGPLAGQKVIIKNEVLKTVKQKNKQNIIQLIDKGHIPRRVIKFSPDGKNLREKEVKQRLSSTEGVIFRRSSRGVIQ